MHAIPKPVLHENHIVLGFSDKGIKQLTGLTQIINIETRLNSILDWCLANKKCLSK